MKIYFRWKGGRGTNIARAVADELALADIAVDITQKSEEDPAEEISLEIKTLKEFRITIRNIEAQLERWGFHYEIWVSGSTRSALPNIKKPLMDYAAELESP